ncbi:MAG: winged helix-turn-helix transcriptional regulator [Paludibacteraceae bacterium]|nr:winged helix-turn-helix transcriptional regulator [Paludibacteraceae bacterium]
MYITIVNNIEINRELRSVRKDGQEIHLTGLEYGLLDYLSNHANRICSRREILDHVWGTRFQYDTGTIDVHLNALRRKLGWSAKQPIESIRGIGLILHTTRPQEEVSPLMILADDWLRAHENELRAHGLTVQLHLTPWVNTLTIHPDSLHKWLDASLETLIPTAQTGFLCPSSRLTMHHFSLSLDINGTITELRTPILRNS